MVHHGSFRDLMEFNPYKMAQGLYNIVDLSVLEKHELDLLLDDGES